MRACAALLLLGAVAAYGQRSGQTLLGADFARESKSFQSTCLSLLSGGIGPIGGCAELLFTGHPLHIAVGSLAPQNGFAAGPAFVGHWTPNEKWRLNWNADAVFSSNGSWRAGGYMTAVLVRRRKIGILQGGTPRRASSSGVQAFAQPTFRVYGETTSLNKVGYFGLGQDTSPDARSWFGLTETITGASLLWPAGTRLNLSLYGEANGRFVSLRGNNGQTSPSIEQRYTEATAPGLNRQPGTAQFGEGVRARPSFVGGHVRLGYAVTYQQFAASESRFSFTRLTTDLNHQFPLYRTTLSYAGREFNGPDQCATDMQTQRCPSVSRNLEGSFGLRFLMTQSFVPGGHAVPFYFAPTLGGSDINGNTSLSSYEDYRFRAPNVILLRGTFEHSLGRWPIGAAFSADYGKVAMRPGDLGLTHLAHSYAAGLTLRAGGFPVVYLLFAWGGQKTHHTIARLDTSLLGGSARPSLY